MSLHSPDTKDCSLHLYEFCPSFVSIRSFHFCQMWDLTCWEGIPLVTVVLPAIGSLPVSSFSLTNFPHPTV